MEHFIIKLLFIFPKVCAIWWFGLVGGIGLQTPGSLALPTANNQTAKQCASGTIYIDKPGKEGCYPLVGLDDQCEFDLQCNLVVPYSFCIYRSPDPTRAVCQCVDDFNATGSNDGCVPLQRCSISDYNSAMVRAECFDPNAFCRHSLCYCKSGYQLNYLGECELQHGETDDETVDGSVVISPLDDYNLMRQHSARQSLAEVQLARRLDDAEARLVAVSQRLLSTQHFILLLLVLQLMFALVIVLKFYSRKHSQSNKHSLLSQQNC